jgi:hypothetical protein
VTPAQRTPQFIAGEERHRRRSNNTGKERECNGHVHVAAFRIWILRNTDTNTSALTAAHEATSTMSKVARLTALPSGREHRRSGRLSLGGARGLTTADARVSGAR